MKLHTNIRMVVTAVSLTTLPKVVLVRSNCLKVSATFPCSKMGMGANHTATPL